MFKRSFKKTFSGRRAGAARPYTRRSALRYKRYNSLKGGRRRFIPKFALVGYAKDTEKKYNDKIRQYGQDVLAVSRSSTISTGTNLGISGFSCSSGDNGIEWYTSTFGNGAMTATITYGDLLKGISVGSTALQRIGNKINVKYIKGTITFNAMTIVGDATVNDQWGEAQISAGGGSTGSRQYMRTEIRVLIIRDLQVNSTDNSIAWSNVMAANGSSGISDLHAELNVNNMGRYTILEEKWIKLDAINPQKTIRFLINGSKIGNVRYNSGASDALTDQGIHIIFSAYSQGADQQTFSGGTNVVMPNPRMQHRICFTDA